MSNNLKGKRSEEFITKIAKYYISTKNATFKSCSKEFAVSENEIAVCLNTELKTINPKLYGKVQEKKAANIVRSRFTSQKKTCWICKFFKK